MANKTTATKTSKVRATKKQPVENVFRYYNCNPHHKTTCDCVIRAIAAGTGETWENTLKNLTRYMLQNGNMLNTPELYGQYLKDDGWVKQKQPVKANGQKMTIKEFLQTFDDCAIIHAGKGHVSYVADGKLYDIWDCSDEIIGNYWTYTKG